MLDPVDERGLQRHRRTGRLDVGQAPEQLPEHHGDLPAGQVGAEAEVRTGTAEAHVVVRLAAHVEAQGIVEHRLVAVGREVEEAQLVAPTDIRAAAAQFLPLDKRVELNVEPEKKQ